MHYNQARAALHRITNPLALGLAASALAAGDSAASLPPMPPSGTPAEQSPTPLDNRTFGMCASAMIGNRVALPTGIVSSTEQRATYGADTLSIRLQATAPTGPATAQPNNSRPEAAGISFFNSCQAVGATAISVQLVKNLSPDTSSTVHADAITPITNAVSQEIKQPTSGTNEHFKLRGVITDQAIRDHRIGSAITVSMSSIIDIPHADSPGPLTAQSHTYVEWLDANDVTEPAVTSARAADFRIRPIARLKADCETRKILSASQTKPIVNLRSKIGSRSLTGAVALGPTDSSRRFKVHTGSKLRIGGLVARETAANGKLRTVQRKPTNIDSAGRTADLLDPTGKVQQLTVYACPRP